MFAQSTATAFGDVYSNFKELSSNTVDDTDYEIKTTVTDSDVIVIAIHGGKIEKGTTELASALSFHNNYNYYSFIGKKTKDNSTLHVTSVKFDEPTALKMVSKSKTTLSIHGCSGLEEFTYIGGLDSELASKIKESLIKYDFTVLDTPKRLAGESPKNIVNKNISSKGVQLEISRGLRTQFLSSDSDKLKNYVLAISEAVNSTKVEVPLKSNTESGLFIENSKLLAPFLVFTEYLGLKDVIKRLKTTFQ
ncbi:poly-gamma-glutamate hydrolase family protein [Alkaliphilus pronyensis]|nr:poly-gamma-glutamate hydrolase family protein [Alkaliphilus pronyensis]